MELPDDWLAIPADDDLRRSFAEPDLDTSDWEPVSVPGHWRSTAAFADADGPLLHRTRFEVDPGADDRRWWLRFDGLFYQGDVWLDGSYVGDTEGYFAPHTFEVTEAVRARSEHVLGVEVNCPPVTDPDHKRQITGSLQDGPGLPAGWTPGGIWRPVHIVDTGPVRIAGLHTRCLEADAERAVLAFRAELDAADTFDAHVRTTVGPVDHGLDHTLAAGANTVEWTVTVERPRLWWPHSLGDAHLHSVTVEVRLTDAAGSRVSDRRRFRTGLRQVAMRRWGWTINGERLFLKGVSALPTRWALAEATGGECAADIAAARDAGLDLVRLEAHVARAETYDAADETGMLIWQDLPLTGGYNRQIRKQATSQATAMVELLGHHPSIALWCGHDRPVDDRDDTSPLRRVLHHQRPSWNRTVLDRAVRRALARADDSRPVVAHTGVLPHLGDLDGSAGPLALGWDHGDVRDLSGLARALPNQVRFPTAIGAHSVPDGFDLASLGWPPIAEATAGDGDGDDSPDDDGGRGRLDRLLARTAAEGRSADEWAAATRDYQADVVRRSVEVLRRLKYRPTGGFLVRHLADPASTISGSLLDADRRPKPALAALAAACAPVIVVADRLPATVAAGDTFALDIHAVSDRRVPVEGTVDVRLAWTDVDGAPQRHRWRFAGGVDADAVARIGTIQIEIEPGTGPIELTIDADFGPDRPRYHDSARRH